MVCCLPHIQKNERGTPRREGKTMRITDVSIAQGTEGFHAFEMHNLEDVVVLVGENGTGKTRLMKLIEKTFRADIQSKDHPGCSLMYAEHDNSVLPNNIEKGVSVLNYSHSDLPLQSPEGFPPHVVVVSKENLEKPNCDFDETAREAFLYLTWLVKYAPKEELDKFNNDYCSPLLGTTLLKGEGNEACSLFGIPLTRFEDNPLSPGQKYLLRLCIALNCCRDPEESILFLDEPESHLHPKALLKLMDKLRVKFKHGQIWIATHSVELLSAFWHKSIWLINDGKAKYIGSRNDEVLEAILGDDSKRGLMFQFLSCPDSYACNAFAVDCLLNPQVLAGATENDPSTALVLTVLEDGDAILDFGCGKGRFLDCLAVQTDHTKFDYYAYDKYGYLRGEETKELKECKETLIKHGLDPKKCYFGSEEKFEKIPLVNKVIMVNVLHEIAPSQWVGTFKTISKKLKENGVLVIVEREELTIGEKPFDSDFFVMQQESIGALLSCKTSDFQFLRHEKRGKVTAFAIPKALLNNITEDSVYSAITAIGEKAKRKIEEIKQWQKEKREEEEGGEEKNTSQKEIWDKGIALAFWTHQYANTVFYHGE